MFIPITWMWFAYVRTGCSTSASEDGGRPAGAPGRGLNRGGLLGRNEPLGNLVAAGEIEPAAFDPEKIGPFGLVKGQLGKPPTLLGVAVAIANIIAEILQHGTLPQSRCRQASF